MKSVIAAVATLVVAAAAAVGFVLTRHAAAGPDPYAGAYPLVTPVPTPTASPAPTWRPAGRPAGRLPVFHGAGSRVAGRITDRVAGVSYARFAAPWHPSTMVTGDTTSAELLDGGSKTVDGRYWYLAVYAGPLPARFAGAAPGRYALRAAAELYGRDWVDRLYDTTDRRTELAGQALTVDRHRAWVSAFRMTHLDGMPRAARSQTEVVVVVDTGHRSPALVTVTVPSNKAALLPDVNTLVTSLRVVR